MRLVVKIGTSSVTTGSGGINDAAIAHLAAEVAAVRKDGAEVVVVTSGAVTAGVAALEMVSRPTDATTLQAVSAIGQHRLMRVYDDAFGAEGLTCAQVLLAPLDFGDRRQYVHARETLLRLIELGVVPIVNENDAVADDEIRFGDNDRLGALVANLLVADLLVLLTDQEGLFNADPRRFEHASLVEEVTAFDAELEATAGGPGTPGGSGGMASKLAAARMASWSAVRAVIASATRPGVLAGAIAGTPGVGTAIAAQRRRLPARKLWIAFALPARGRVVVDAGARRALVERDASLLPAGVRSVTGSFVIEDAIEIADEDGEVFAKGIARLAAANATAWAGRRTAELPDELAVELVHRDDLVLLSPSGPGVA
jgi:glutamate 5-kinase